MPRLAVITLLITLRLQLFAQSPDSLINKLDVDNVMQRVQAVDTLANPAFLDSLREGVTGLDKLDSAALAKKQKLDSLETSVATKFDSLKQSYDSIASTANKAVGRYQQKVDSLTRLNLPTAKLTAKIDSITNWRNSKLGVIKAKADSIRDGALKKINDLELPPALQDQAQNLTSGLNKLDVKIPSAEMPDLSFANPLQKSVPGLQNPVGELSLPGLPDAAMNVPQTGLENVTGQIPKVEGLSSLGEVGEQVEKVSDMVPKNTEDLSKTIEQQATKIDGMQGVNEQLSQADKYKDVLAPGQDPEAMKKEVLQKAKQTAIDHFAGKEKQLQEAMQKIAKYKQKYSSVQSLADLPKKKPNEMRNKPLIERLTPGIAFQIHRRDEWLVDFNPYVGYRFTGRLTAGAGWNQRVAYNAHDKAFVSRYSIYGPRFYGEFKAFKGISGKAEIEWMNTFVPPAFSSTPNDPEHRQWIFSTMVGMKKSYRFYKNVKGTVSLMYNVYDPHHRSPYGDRLNMRFGFEFPMKKKTKKNSSDQSN